MTRQVNDLAAKLARRAQQYWLLSRLIGEQPDAGLVQTVLATADLLELDGAARAALEGPLSDLQVEFTRLFGGLGPGYSAAPPPFASAAGRDAAVDAPSAELLAAAYAALGFGHPWPALGPEDHLAVMVRVAAMLAYLGVCGEAESEADDDASDTPEALRNFVHQYFSSWFAAYMQKAEAAAPGPLYRSVLISLGRLLDEDGDAYLVPPNMAELQRTRIHCP